MFEIYSRQDSFQMRCSDFKFFKLSTVSWIHDEFNIVEYVFFLTLPQTADIDDDLYRQILTFFF